MSSQNSLKREIRHLWETTTWSARYIAHKYSLTEQSVRRLVTGVKGPKKEKKSLSAYHRAVGMKLIDKRQQSRLNKQEFAHACGMSHFRLNDLEKGYDDITITEILRTEILEELTLLDTTLLEIE